MAGSQSHTMAGPRSVTGLRDGGLAIVGALLLASALAWLATAARMAGMDAGPGTDPGTPSFYMSTWVVMMAAMMLPSVAPALLAYRGRRAGQLPPATRARLAAPAAPALYVVGYLAVWAACGLVGYAVLKGGHALDGGFFAWRHGGRWVAAGVLALAAAYELTPAKRACLARCRGARPRRPGGARDGHFGSLRAGVLQGGWCLGCCSLLMAGLFALGAMSLLWMVLVALLIAAQKLLPWPTAASVASAAVLAALALGFLLAPAQVPGLTVPHGGGMGAMSMPAMRG